MGEHVDGQRVGAVARLARFEQAYWSLNLYPDAGEAGGCFVSASGGAGRGRPRGGSAADPERSRAESARRSRARLRRYAAGNRLNRLGTLTYGPPFCGDPRQLRADLGEFFRALREGLGGQQLP